MNAGHGSETSGADGKRRRLWLLIAAFGAVYLIWGSTYLGILWAMEGLPPFFMAGSRFVIAGAIMYAVLRARGVAGPTGRQWVNATIIGVLLLSCGNGTVTWSEQYAPTGLIALLIAMVPMWMVVLNMLLPAPGGGGGGGGGVGGIASRRPSAGVAAGLLLGLAGVFLLIRGRNGDFSGLGEGLMPKIAAAAMVFSTLAWSVGSLVSRRIDMPRNLFMSTAAQMISGGAVLLVVSAGWGELGVLSWERLTVLSVLSHAYLIVFGSIIAFSAYVWLLGATTPARVSTYAYVNPVVAVGLGWLLAGERLSGQTLLAGAVIVAGVAMIITAGQKRRSAPPKGTGAEPPASALAAADSATPVLAPSADSAPGAAGPGVAGHPVPQTAGPRELAGTRSE